MNKETKELVEKLSKNDPKTLKEKVLKTMEELGELSKAVLPFEGAPGSLHKFADRQKILEEVADTILGAISVAYNLEFTHDQIDNMLWQKANYWAKLQSKEKNNPFPIPFELHVTVAKDSEVEKFKQVCLTLGVKPIVLELVKDNKKVLDEIMTSSIFIGDSVAAQAELEKISKILAVDFKVERMKIETAPWHPAAPSCGLGQMKQGNYFEAHLDVKVQENQEELIFNIAKYAGAVVSVNSKKVQEASKTIMLTLRSYQGFWEDFEPKVNQLYQTLLSNNFEVERPNTEYSLYDSAVTHDLTWTEK